LINNGFHARRCSSYVLRGEASRVVGHLAGKSHDTVLCCNVNGSGLEERVGIKFGFDAGGDRVVAGLVASESEEQ